MITNSNIDRLIELNNQKSKLLLEYRETMRAEQCDYFVQHCGVTSSHNQWMVIDILTRQVVEYNTLKKVIRNARRKGKKIYWLTTKRKNILWKK